MDVNATLTRLARIAGAATPVVSVYLNTRWADEHQRDRVRVFLKNEIRKARKSPGAKALEADLGWIEGEGEALIAQARFPGANGVALFACRGLDLREVLPVRVPFEDAFVIAEVPHLAPLATLRREVPAALVVFVDGESARLIPLNAEGAGLEVALESEVPGHHRRGGWAQLAQSRYQRHIQDHKGRHFEAVARALVGLAEGNRVERVVMAGEPRTLAAFQKHLPRRIAARVVGSIGAARYEPAKALLGRAARLLGDVLAREEGPEVETVLTEAAKGRWAIAGVEGTIEAVNRGAVRRLYVLKGFNEAGRVCNDCGTLQRGPGAACRLCGKATRATDLAAALVDRVIARGGEAETVRAHPGLARVGGLAALLRYPF